MAEWWRSRPALPVEPCNATELLLRSGRVGPPVAEPEVPPDEVVAAGLDDLGHRLGVALIVLAPHRASRDDGLRRAYRAVHDAMGDLGAVLLQVSGPRRPARRARPARRRRPWGARS